LSFFYGTYHCGTAWEGLCPVSALVGTLTVSQPTVSKHLRVLRDAGFVEARTDAQRRLYRVNAEPLREVDTWLAPGRAKWTSSLDALERHLSEMGDQIPAENRGERRERRTEHGR
jgi:DNA-binding transcriptional ArsR family regulator